METLEREATRDLLLLSLTAGSADAAGFLGLGRVFTSNMTGNVVLLGIDLGQEHFLPALRDIYVLGVFIIGLCLGAWLGRNVPEKRWAALVFRLIGLEKILLMVFGIVWCVSYDKTSEFTTYGLLSLLALAMGLQSSALFRLSAPGVGTTAVTGTLTAFANGLSQLLFPTFPNPVQREAMLRRVRFQLYVVVLYSFGAALSGFFIMRGVPWVGFLPILAALFVSFGQARH